MNRNPRKNREHGIALVTAMLILLLLSALLAAFTMLVMTDQGINGIDRDQSIAFYAAYGGMEKMTADLAAVFNTDYAAPAAKVNAIMATPPPFTGINFIDPKVGTPGSGYAVTFPKDNNGNPLASNAPISKGPYQGFIGLITPFTLTITASSLTGSEVRLRRTLETVAIPVFQFGIFSETDLSFFAGPVFKFGGRVHTNGNLWLAGGATLTLSDRVTAVGEVVRTNLANGWLTNAGYTGTVDVTTAPGTGLVRPLAMNEGSVVGKLGTALNDPTWTNLSYGAYNSNLRNGRTGAKPLNLALTTFGASPIEMIRLPLPNELTANPQLFALRYFAQSSLRILLADKATDITNLDTVCAAPVPLQGPVLGAGPTIPPFAASSGNAGQGYWTNPGITTIGGFITIEIQDTGGNCVDVTQEILKLGIAGRNLSTGVLNTPGVGLCADPNPDAVIRIQRVRDVPQSAGALGFCGVNAGVVDLIATDYWPNVLFDTREGTLRDTAPAFAPNLMYSGVISYVELDVNNLSRWFTGLIGASGPNAINITGYTVYFSDRRNNAVDPVLNRKNGEFGFEDIVNSTTGGAPDNKIEQGEDLDGTGVLVTYGQVPSPLSPSMSNQIVPNVPPTATVPWLGVDIAHARVNAPIFFRRALKLVNGQSINLGNCSAGTVVCGLTVAAENPVYIQGNYNSTSPLFTGAHVATSVITDALTLLSANWNDIRSFTSPYNRTGRPAADSWYRVAVVSGKGMSFPQPPATSQDFGTDGGVHNFLRYLENWGGRQLNYRGSIVSFYYNRQAVGVYKCCTTVYGPPTRGYNFDVEFLQPTLLPPKTPMFRDVDITGFTQLIMPNQ